MPRTSDTQVTPSEQRDTKIPGLVLRHRSTRSSWHLSYRTKAGRRRNPKIGDAVIGLTKAREIAREILVRVARGEDPEAQPHHTVQQLADRYHDLFGSRKKSAPTERWKWDERILPVFAAKPVASITLNDLTDFHHSLRDTPILANRLIELFMAALRKAKRWGWISVVPERPEAYPERKRRRYPLPHEIHAILAAADAHSDPWFRGLVYLLLLTGCRKSELLKARRSDVEPLGLHLRDSKTGARVVPLSTAARDVVARLPVAQNDDRLLPTANHWNKWKALRESIGAPDLVIHDLRRGYASAGISAGLTLEQVMQLLGHTSAQTTKRYAYLHQEVATRAANATAAAILS